MRKVGDVGRIYSSDAERSELINRLRRAEEALKKLIAERDEVLDSLIDRFGVAARLSLIYFSYRTQINDEWENPQHIFNKQSCDSETQRRRTTGRSRRFITTGHKVEKLLMIIETDESLLCTVWEAMKSFVAITRIQKTPKEERNVVISWKLSMKRFGIQRHFGDLKCYFGGHESKANKKNKTNKDEMLL